MLTREMLEMVWVRWEDSLGEGEAENEGESITLGGTE